MSASRKQISSSGPDRPDPGRAPSGRIISVRAATAIAVVATVAVLASVIGVVCQWRTAATDDAVDRTRAELRREAGRIVAQVFSVDAARWRADRERARGLVDGEFAARYATELTRPPADGARSVVWTPEVVGIVDAAPDHGDTLIRARIVVTPASAAPAADDIEHRSVTAGFDRVDDRWVLTRVEVLS